MNDLILLDSSAMGHFMMNGYSTAISSAPTVGQMVSEQPHRARVFEKWGLSYCCGNGQVSLREACRHMGIDAHRVEADLRVCDRQKSMALVPATRNWSSASAHELTEHMAHEHHAYLRAELPRLSYLIDRVANSHGACYPELWELQGLFEEFKEELELHLDREEKTIMPRVKSLEAAVSWHHFEGMFSSPITALKKTHSFLVMALAKMRHWTHDYSAPNGACNTYKVLLDGLGTLEANLIDYLHEEEILFDRALQTENALNAFTATSSSIV